MTLIYRFDKFQPSKRQSLFFDKHLDLLKEVQDASATSVPNTTCFRRKRHLTNYWERQQSP